MIPTSSHRIHGIHVAQMVMHLGSLVLYGGTALPWTVFVEGVLLFQFPAQSWNARCATTITHVHLLYMLCPQVCPIMFIFPQPVNIVERLPPGERPWLELQVVRPKQDKFGCGRGPKCKPTARNNAGKPPRLPLGCPCHEEMKFAEFSGRKGL